MSVMKFSAFGALVLSAAFALPFTLARPVLAEENVPLSLSVKDHVFSPAELKLPAGKVVMLTVKNEDSTAIEFECKPFKIEKPVGANASVVIRIKVPEAGKKILFVDEPREDKTLGYFIVE